MWQRRFALRFCLQWLTRVLYSPPQLISDPRTGRSTGYAFVTFADEAAAAAVKARGKLDVYGRTVDVGAPQGSRPPGTYRPGAAGIPADRRAFVGGLPREARARAPSRAAAGSWPVLWRRNVATPIRALHCVR